MREGMRGKEGRREGGKGGERGREGERWKETRQRAREKRERMGKGSEKNLLTAGKAWGEGAAVAKGSVAWCWHVAQESDNVGSDHSSSTWQLHSLGQLT